MTNTLTTNEVAKLLNMTVANLYQLRMNRKLTPCSTQPKKMKWDIHDIQEYLNASNNRQPFTWLRTNTTNYEDLVISIINNQVSELVIPSNILEAHPDLKVIAKARLVKIICIERT